MTRGEFMISLNNLLSDISYEERQEALKYYQDYFEDAGSENESMVVQELGSPEKVAALIKSGLQGNTEEGIYTETGYYTGEYEKKFEVEKSAINLKKEKSETQWDASQSQSNNTTQDQGFKSHYEKETVKSRSGIKILLIFAIVLFGLPIIITVFSVGLAVLASILGIAIGMLGVTLGFTVGGVVTIVIGIVQITMIPMDGILICGLGFLLFGIGILASILMTWIFKVAIPFVVKIIIQVCQIPFKNRTAPRV